MKVDGELKVKRHAMVFTSPKANPGPKGEVKQEEQASSNHITVRKQTTWILK